MADRTPRALSNRQVYLDSLRTPTPAEGRRITDIQLQKESVIDGKYHQHSQAEHDAATIIQAAYRGHRERRHLDGLTLDPSSRWVDAIREWRYRSVIAPHYSDSQAPNGKMAASPSDKAKQNWRRVGWVAEHAGRGDDVSRPTSSGSNLSGQGSYFPNGAQSLPDSMLMDLRYFLEMVDQKHRYGANLQMYHEFWQKQQTKQNFFLWLDHGAGRGLDLPLCSREKLDRERIRYLSKEERKDYLVRIDEYGTLRWDKNGDLISTTTDYKDSVNGIVPKDAPDPTFNDGTVQDDIAVDHQLAYEMASVGHLEPIRDPDTCEGASDEDTSNKGGTLGGNAPTLQNTTQKKHRKPFHVSPGAMLNHLLRASIKPGTWIYVADTVGRLYISIKSSGAFQHASFLSGGRISSAGSIGVEDGKLTYLSPLSGHYRPTTKSFRDFHASLEARGVDMSHLRVSGAYKVLRGMEVYSKTKQGLSKVKHPKDKSERKSGPPSPGSKEQKTLDALHEAHVVSATQEVEANWEQGHRTRLTKAFKGLHGRAKSRDSRKASEV